MDYDAHSPVVDVIRVVCWASFHSAQTTRAAQDLSEVPAVQRRKTEKPLEYYAKKHADRDEAITQAYASGSYGMKEIGDHFGLHYSRVSRILAELRFAKGKTSTF